MLHASLSASLGSLFVLLAGAFGGGSRNRITQYGPGTRRGLSVAGLTYAAGSSSQGRARKGDREVIGTRSLPGSAGVVRTDPEASATGLPSVPSNRSARSFASRSSPFSAPAQSREMPFLRAFDTMVIDSLRVLTALLRRLSASVRSVVPAASSKRLQTRSCRGPIDAGS